MLNINLNNIMKQTKQIILVQRAIGPTHQHGSSRQDYNRVLGERELDQIKHQEYENAVHEMRADGNGKTLHCKMTRDRVQVDGKWVSRAQIFLSDK
jgi:hypothetical protein